MKGKVVGERIQMHPRSKERDGLHPGLEGTVVKELDDGTYEVLMEPRDGGKPFTEFLDEDDGDLFFVIAKKDEIKKTVSIQDLMKGGK